MEINRQRVETVYDIQCFVVDIMSQISDNYLVFCNFYSLFLKCYLAENYLFISNWYESYGHFTEKNLTLYSIQACVVLTTLKKKKSIHHNISHLSGLAKLTGND